MKERPSHVIPLLTGVALAGLLLWWLLPGRPGGSIFRRASPVGADLSGADGSAGAADDAQAAARERAAAVDGATLMATYLDQMGQAVVRANEAVLTFKNQAAYQAFLARAAAAGLEVVGRLDGVQTVRVRYASVDALQSDVLGNASDYSDVSANYLVSAPTAPPPESRTGVQQIPVNNNLLSALGVTGDHSQWGSGVTIAVLDSGVAADPTLGGRVQYLDVGQGTVVAPGDGHGTSVASLAAGAAADAPGVAPSATVLSVRVTADDGTSDLFTLSQAIINSVEKGAQIVNISMGSYGTSGVLTDAIDYATEHGVLIVASAGNDQAAQLVWPAADPRVISVGAVDAAEQQVLFSNSGPQLKITAPGYDVQAASLDGQRVNFTGTSASAPVVSGAIAAMLSQNPGLNAVQAWQVLQQYSSDAGTPGVDPNYGSGIVNLGWAMNRADTTRVDTAVSSPVYDPATGNVQYLVQNRGGAGIGGGQLNLEVGGVTTAYPLPWLEPGATTVVETTVDQSALAVGGSVILRAQLVNPPGQADAVPANNRRASVLSPPAN